MKSIKLIMGLDVIYHCQNHIELFSASNACILVKTTSLFQILVKLFDFVFGIVIWGHSVTTHTHARACVCVCVYACACVRACFLREYMYTYMYTVKDKPFQKEELL
jgi:hypothetical protein